MQKKENTQVVKHQQWFNVNLYVVQIINIVSIIITFGVAFPPVAVVGLCALLSMTEFTQKMILTRLYYLQRVNATEHTEQYLQMLNADCANARQLFFNTVWVLVPFVSVFFSLLVMDTLGDEVGWRRAIWAPVLICAVPLLCMLLTRIARALNIDGIVWVMPIFGAKHSGGEVAEPLLEPEQRTQSDNIL